MTSRASDVPLVQRAAAELVRWAAPGSRCLIAVSGGPDSLALLDLLHLGQAQHQCDLLVGHVDHGIHADSSTVAKQIAAAAAERGLTFASVRLDLASGTSETRARRARRAALRALGAAAGVETIVLAHHADDQAETVLLRLLRGSGPAGLAGMAARHGPWVRPLLAVPRSELTAHLAARGLSAWIDPANSDPRHLRSWLRTAVLPMLATRLPDLVDRLGRAASQAAEARTAWQQLSESLPELHVERASGSISVAGPVLQGYRSPLRHAILAMLGRKMGVLLGARRLAVMDRLLASESGSGTIWLAKRFRAELAFGRLTLYQVESGADEGLVALLPGGPTRVGAGNFSIRVGPADAVSRTGPRTALVPGWYQARRWRRGDRIRPLGGTGSRPVAVLFREARVSPSRRLLWPVVVNADDATIVWVPGICRADAVVPAEGTEAWCVECAFA